MALVVGLDGVHRERVFPRIVVGYLRAVDVDTESSRLGTEACCAELRSVRGLVCGEVAVREPKADTRNDEEG